MATQALMLERAPAETPELSTVVAAAGRGRVELGGVRIDNVSLREAVERIAGFLHAGGFHQVVTVNLDFLSIARRDAGFHDTLNRADLAVADGMPLVWISRLRREPLAERVTGVSLVDECCRLAAQDGRGVFLLGAGAGVAEAAGRALVDRFPGLRVAGAYSPPIGPLTRRENARIVRMIRAAQPGFLFVALGAPRQDLWIRENLSRLEVPVALGVGCVFDVLAGSRDRAPSWMQRSGLEWAYRLVQEPSRLWRRYLLNDSRTFGHLLLETLRTAPTISAETAALPT
jgi:N-acetylglucosaminyldiphosphoundecaprenol N-acetyl-beta-D-mannosaminyltransferase